jgi:2,4-dienoyl-CoA reductase-like NADH-dependent reductase (Old Yellow Enzyme family)
MENGATLEGKVTEQLVNMYRNLTKGGAGLIITGFMNVLLKYRAPGRAMRLDTDDFIPGVKQIADMVHEYGNDTRVMAQIHLPGRQVPHPGDAETMMPYIPPALLTYITRTGSIPQPEEGKHPDPSGPSAVYDAFFKRTPRELNEDEIEEIIDAFAESIRRAEEAGFDGVQLHAAHGWLLSTFLSPHTNKREDRFGGSTENRARLITEIYQRGRARVADDFPILIKMNLTDFLPGGLDNEEATRLAALLKKAGFAAIETSGGMWECMLRDEEELGFPPLLLPESRTKINNPSKEAYFLREAQEVKRRTDGKIILVGGIRSFEKAEAILENGAADFISMARPFIRQPDLPNLWMRRETHKSACISCNACLPLGESLLTCRALEK